MALRLLPGHRVSASGRPTPPPAPIGVVGAIGAAGAAVDDLVVDGLSVWARAMDDLGLGRAALSVYRAAREPFLTTVRPGETSRVAFTATLLRPERRRCCFAVVLADRAVVAWPRRGSTGMLTIPLADVEHSAWRIGTAGSVSGVSLLHVRGRDQEWVFGLPSFRPAAADLLRDAFRPVPA